MKMLVVGAGPSGLHCAQTLLEHGHQVTMLDVGRHKDKPVLPAADFAGLKDDLDDPVEYFLGGDARGVVFPANEAKYYAFPPSKDYVFDRPDSFRHSGSGFEPLFSFAAGGLAEAWTGGAYPLNDAELTDFPFSFDDIRDHYATVVERIGISALRDDLAQFSPWFEGYETPVSTDVHSSRLIAGYDHARKRVNDELGFYLGRSRVALIAKDRHGRKGCDMLGRCLWGCPNDSLYAPSSTLRELHNYDGFTYVDDRYVTNFDFEGDCVTTVLARDAAGRIYEYSSDVYILAAGALCSSKVFLDSLYAKSGEVYTLEGLMDNRQMMVPFISPRMIGRTVDTHAYQLHQIALGIVRPRAEEYVHGQITTLKSCAIHPIVHSMPFGLRTALHIFRATHAALAVANVWLHDRRRSDNTVTIRPRDDGLSELVTSYTSRNEVEVDETISLIKRALFRLGCIVPPGMAKILEMGSSVHYAGTIPMHSAPRARTCDPNCRSHDFRNLYFVDGASFPFLPAKNLTFSLMANATRVACAIDKTVTDGPVS